MLLFVILCRVFNIATCAVAAAWAVVTIFARHVLAGLLYGALDAEALHILVGRDLGVDMVPLENQRQRHCQNKKSNRRYGYNNYR